MRLSRASAETAEEDVRPSTRGVPPSGQQRESGFRDTVQGGRGKQQEGRNDDFYHEETRLPERGYLGDCPENRGVGLTSYQFESQREIQDLTREEWLRRGTPNPRPDYRLPYKVCWACGARGRKRGSPECHQTNAVVCFGCGEPGRTKATCHTCSELWESTEVLPGRRKARPGQ